jgi:hypothetical protein
LIDSSVEKNHKKRGERERICIYESAENEHPPQVESEKSKASHPQTNQPANFFDLMY